MCVHIVTLNKFAVVSFTLLVFEVKEHDSPDPCICLHSILPVTSSLLIFVAKQ